MLFRSSPRSAFPEKQIEEIVTKLACAATAKATWLLADFCMPQNGFARLRAQAWLALMYRFFRYTAGIEANELVDPSPFLRAAGFVLVRQHIFRNGMLTSEVGRNIGILPVRPADMMSAASPSAE